MPESSNPPRPQRRLEGRVALVTGGASGIGRGTAQRLVMEGASVVVADIQRSLADELCAELTAAGGRASAVTCDVSREQDVMAAVDHARHLHGRIDILVNVAGGSSPSKLPAGEMPLAEFNRVMAINLTGTYLLIHHVVPLMKAQRYGRIINVTSTAAIVTSDRTTPAYASAKAAIAGLTRQLVFDYSRFGITANSIAPGHIRTPIALRLGEALLNERIRLIPVGRLGEPEDVAAAIAFMASDDAGFLNGQMLVLDGGQTSVMNYAASLSAEGG